MKTAVRDYRPGDIEAIVADARPGDVEEMAAMRTTVEQALRDGVRLSPWVGVGTIDGVPVCMFGVSPRGLLAGVGEPWMLATNRLQLAKREFLRASKPVLRVMLEDFPRLVNIVHARNTEAIRWLRWLGFDVSHQTVPVFGHPFHVFRAGDWHV